MLPLDSTEWGRIRHAYGEASDIPNLVRQLVHDPGPKMGHSIEPWFSLWSALCHQGDVYEASYAAVPHLVEIGTAARRPVSFDFFLLPACIEVCRAKGRGPALPASLAAAYWVGLQGLHECAFQHAKDDWPAEMAQSVAAALAASKGQHELAEAIISLDDDIIARLIAADWTLSGRSPRT